MHLSPAPSRRTDGLQALQDAELDAARVRLADKWERDRQRQAASAMERVRQRQMGAVNEASACVVPTACLCPHMSICACEQSWCAISGMACVPDRAGLVEPPSKWQAGAEEAAWLVQRAAALFDFALGSIPLHPCFQTSM